MTVKQIPDYDLDEMIVVTAPGQLRALADPLRGTLLDLLLERAATVTEMALAVDRPKSTVAYHVNLLVDAGLLRVVRTRRVRAIEERYYGRVARTIYIGALQPRRGQADRVVHQRARAGGGGGRTGPRGRRSALLAGARADPERGSAELLGRGARALPPVRADPAGRRSGLRLRGRPLPHRRAHPPRHGGRARRLRPLGLRPLGPRPRYAAPLPAFAGSREAGRSGRRRRAPRRRPRSSPARRG